MLIDLHAHTKAISKCCKADIAEVIEAAKSQGIDGVVLTNHFQKSYFANTSEEMFTEAYIQEYYTMREEAHKTGFRCFFGVEVSMERYPSVHMLIYGLDPNFLRTNRGLCDLSLQELYGLVRENNGILIQAHPFRNGTTIMDTAFLDGVEINCHPLYKRSYCTELIARGKADRRCVTCGGDYHADTYRPKCGVYLPETVQTEQELAMFLKHSKTVTLCVHEPNGTPVEIVLP